MDNQELDDAVAQTPAASEPVSHREDVHNDVAEAIRSLKGKPAADVSAVAPGDGAGDDHPDKISAPASDRGEDRPRGPDGKFLPKELAADAPKQAAPAQDIPSTDTAKAIEPQVSTPAIDPPVGWTAAEKAEWSKLPPAVQAAVNRREQEISRGGQQWSEEKRRYEAVLAPAAQAFKARNLSVEDGINRLLQAQDFLDREPSRAIQWLAQSYGVDLQNLESNPAPQAPRFDPVVQQFEQKVSYLEDQLQGLLATQINSTFDRFKADHPHFEAVRADMGRIVQTLDQTLPELELLSKAYEIATWGNPDIRAKLIAEQQTQAQQQQADALKAKAQQAAKAAVSIKGSSGGVSVPRKPPAEILDETPYDTVARTIRELRAQ